MLLQAALNGGLAKSDHPAMPVSPAELADDVALCAEAGARAFHLHPCGADGRESLDPRIVDGVVEAATAGQPYPVGVTTGAWIEPDLGRRLALLGDWTRPAYASVNISESGSIEVIDLLLSIGIGVEAGVWSVDDADVLVRSGRGNRVRRILVEPDHLPGGETLELVGDIHRVLDLAGVAVPRLQHSDSASAWPVLEDAVRRGIDTRIGFEDTLLLPDGSVAGSNAELIAAAVALGAGRA